MAVRRGDSKDRVRDIVESSRAKEYWLLYGVGIQWDGFIVVQTDGRQ